VAGNYIVFATPSNQGPLIAGRYDTAEEAMRASNDANRRDNLSINDKNSSVNGRTTFEAREIKPGVNGLESGNTLSNFTDRTQPLSGMVRDANGRPHYPDTGDTTLRTGYGPSREGGGLARIAGRSFGILGGIFTGAATLVGGGGVAEAAQAVTPGGDAAAAFYNGRRVEGVIGGIEELIGPLAEPLRMAARAAGADVDPGLVESTFRASNNASGNINRDRDDYQNTLSRLRQLTPEQARDMGGDVAGMHALLTQRDAAQARMDGLPPTGAARQRQTASRTLGAAENNLRQYYEDLKDTPDFQENFLARLPDPQAPRAPERNAPAPNPVEPQNRMVMGGMGAGPG
jgi:hypothetical protein